MLIALYFLGLLVPQRSLFPSQEAYILWKGESSLNALLAWLQITEIYTSPLTVVFLSLFFGNLLMVTLDRIPLVLRRTFLKGKPCIEPEQMVKSQDLASVAAAGTAAETGKRVATFFRSKRWSVLDGEASGTFVALRNRYSPLGFFLFHGSFFLCLAGALLLAYSRFSCRIDIAEGETVQGRLGMLGKVERRPLLFTTLPEVSFAVGDIETRYEQGAASDLSVDLLSVIDGFTQEDRVRINEPMSRGAVTAVPHNVGLAPLVVVRDPAGREVDRVWVKLNVLKGRADSFSLGSRGQYSVGVRYFPDYVVYNGAETTRSQEPRDPAFHLLIARGEQTLFDGTVRVGEPADMEGFSVAFEKLGYWVELQVIREYGTLPLVLGFVLAAIGLVMRLVFYQKRIEICIVGGSEGTAVLLRGRADYFPHTFSGEFESLVAELRDRLRET